MQNQAQSARASQDFVPIEQVRDGIVVLGDGSVRAVIMASSVNIMLKSHDEQMAILGQFQTFLNSLDFSIEISIQSRELDIRPYLEILTERIEQQPSELMKIQVREYMDFVKNLIADSNIMTKNFYVIVPYTPPMEIAGSKGGLLSAFSPRTQQTRVLSPHQLEESRSQLEQRIAVVAQGLSRLGVRAAQLGTEEVIELFYHLFNIGELNRPLPVQDLSVIGKQQ